MDVKGEREEVLGLDDELCFFCLPQQEQGENREGNLVRMNLGAYEGRKGQQYQPQHSEEL